MEYIIVVAETADSPSALVQFLSVSSSWLSQTSSLFQAFLTFFMQCLAWIFVILIILYSWIYL